MDEVKARLKKQSYHLIGDHSAVKICGWTKNSLKGEGTCYKQKFYGINAHQCVQMTPSFTCDMECVFCWRNMESHTDIKMKGKIDSPEDIIEGSFEGQRILLSGMGGNPKTKIAKFEQSKQPKHFAISLTGEPTMYPKLNELIQSLHDKGITTFVVTNGMFPSKLENIIPPTQLYMSLDAPNEDLFYKIDNPLQKKAWELLNRSLDAIAKLRSKTKTTLRLTILKGINDTDIQGYAKLIKKANPTFVEVKGYMWIGSSRERLAQENMPRHPEVKEFALKIAKELGWEFIDESEPSRVCLLSAKKRTKKEMHYSAPPILD